MIRIDGMPVDFEWFPNGETRFPAFQPHHSTVDLKYEDDSDLIKLMMVAKHLRWRDNLFIDYMPYSRMDRVKSDDQVFSLKYIAEFINSLKFKHVQVVEPHSDVTMALLNNVEPVWVVPDLVKQVKAAINFDSQRDYLVFPDQGAAKRYSFDDRCQLIGIKNRDFNNGQITSLQLVHNGPASTGNKAIIVDDLCSYGGTFVRTAKALRKMYSFKEIHLVVAHAEPVMFDGELFDYVDSVTCTDSMWTHLPTHPKLRMVRLDDIL